MLSSQCVHIGSSLSLITQIFLLIMIQVWITDALHVLIETNKIYLSALNKKPLELHKLSAVNFQLPSIAVQRAVEFYWLYQLQNSSLKWCRWVYCKFTKETRYAVWAASSKVIWTLSTSLNSANESVLINDAVRCCKMLHVWLQELWHITMI